MFYRAQTENEQAHIASALVFELSKVGLDHVRARVVGQLRNIDESLAKRVADDLAIELPAKEKAARAPVDHEPSDELSIQQHADDTQQGRTSAILYATGTDHDTHDKRNGASETSTATACLFSLNVAPNTVTKN